MSKENEVFCIHVCVCTISVIFPWRYTFASTLADTVTPKKDARVLKYF